MKAQIYGLCFLFKFISVRRGKSSLDLTTASLFSLAMALILSVKALTSSMICAARWMKNFTTSMIAMAAFMKAPTGVSKPITHLIPA